MHVDHFDWDDESDASGNTRHIESAGHDPIEIEDAILAHRGPIAMTRESGRPMIRATTADGKDLIIVFEIDGDDDFILVRPVTAFLEED